MAQPASEIKSSVTEGTSTEEAADPDSNSAQTSESTESESEQEEKGDEDAEKIKAEQSGENAATSEQAGDEGTAATAETDAKPAVSALDIMKSE